MLEKWKTYISNSLKRRVKLYTVNCIQAVQYFFEEDRSLKINKPSYIVMVCKGNVCRSAFAEYHLRRIVKNDKVTIESCGLDVDQGNYAPEKSVETARFYDIDLSAHRSKGLPQCNVEKADLILAMELRQYRRLVSLFPHKKARIKLLRTYAPFPLSLLCNIDDPYGRNNKEYMTCYSLIDRSLKGLLVKYNL